MKWDTVAELKYVKVYWKVEVSKQFAVAATEPANGQDSEALKHTTKESCWISTAGGLKEQVRDL